MLHLTFRTAAGKNWVVKNQSLEGLPPGTPQSDNYNKGTPLGSNNDPKKVFTVIEEEGTPVLKITGEIYGGLTTLKEYGDYHYSFEVKFGEKKWAPRLDRARDSGLLYHCTGKHGAFLNVWMRSLAGSEVYFRNIRLRPITAFSAAIAVKGALSQ